MITYLKIYALTKIYYICCTLHCTLVMRTLCLINTRTTQGLMMLTIMTLLSQVTSSIHPFEEPSTFERPSSNEEQKSSNQNIEDDRDELSHESKQLNTSTTHYFGPPTQNAAKRRMIYFDDSPFNGFPEFLTSTDKDHYACETLKGNTPQNPTLQESQDLIKCEFMIQGNRSHYLRDFPATLKDDSSKFVTKLTMTKMTSWAELQLFLPTDKSMYCHATVTTTSHKPLNILKRRRFLQKPSYGTFLTENLQYWQIINNENQTAHVCTKACDALHHYSFNKGLPCMSDELLFAFENPIQLATLLTESTNSKKYDGNIGITFLSHRLTST